MPWRSHSGWRLRPTTSSRTRCGAPTGGSSANRSTRFADARYRSQRSTQYAAVAALTLLVVALTAYVERPDAYEQAAPPPLVAVAPAELDPSGTEPKLGPLASALQNEIVAALKATEWPQLDPSMESVISDPAVTD